ncbi:MAG: hypothetical protein Q8N81_05655, partial [bacterium]|nr:hypothetical protein [bacterium]
MLTYYFKIKSFENRKGGKSMKANFVRAEIVLRAAVLILGLSLAQTVIAQTWVEERTFISKGQVVARIDGLVTKSYTAKLGGFVWFQTQKCYSESYG